MEKRANPDHRKAQNNEPQMAFLSAPGVHRKMSRRGGTTDICRKDENTAKLRVASSHW